MTQLDRNEADTRAELIDPAIKEAGWGDVAGSRVRREVITLGRLIGGGRRGKQDIADYVLLHKNQKLAVIEAKRERLAVTEGLGQAKNYAQKLQTPFAYSTNGHGIYRVDMRTGEEGDVNRYPTPDELWAEAFAESELQERLWQARFSEVPYDNNGGQWDLRFYKYNAITKILEAIAKGRDRILLTLATGTGKTSVAFEVAWKLFHSRWNLTDWRNGVGDGQEPSRRPRILFLADRNILADQAFNAFSAFPEDALIRIAPDVIRKKGRVPKNGSVFFTIFQTFMSGSDEEGNAKPNFGDYPPDFFDLIVVDECHRGGASDESTWRAILDYFSPAVQLGLTATPKRTNNVDTYAYFGDPVYVYSLKEGINDGFLTPFKVKDISTTLDEYVYEPDDLVMEGDVEPGKRYTEAEFNRIIEIRERERARVKIFMDLIDQEEKTLVFCANQEHALAVRDLVNQAKASSNPNYCVRVTADEGAIGDQHLRTFQDNEKSIPTVLTTSHKLSTGVDARNIRNIVLMRPIKSMIEFKQIIGRGTRLYDGKDYFTIFDFVKAYHHFNDPEWDGEPIEPPEPNPKPPPRDPPEPGPEPDPDDEPIRPEKVKVKLADGKERMIQHMVSTSYWSADGKPISASEFIAQLFGELPALFKNEEELRALWSTPSTRRKLLEGLAERGFGIDQLAEIAQMVNAEGSDLFDVLAYVAYATPPITRAERVESRKVTILSAYEDNQREFLDFVLDQYVRQGVGELDQDKLPQLLELKYHAVADAVSSLGSVTEIRELFTDFQEHLYEPRAVA